MCDTPIVRQCVARSITCAQSASNDIGWMASSTLLLYTTPLSSCLSASLVGWLHLLLYSYELGSCWLAVVFFSFCRAVLFSLFAATTLVGWLHLLCRYILVLCVVVFMLRWLDGFICTFTVSCWLAVVLFSFCRAVLFSLPASFFFLPIYIFFNKYPKGTTVPKSKRNQKGPSKKEKYNNATLTAGVFFPPYLSFLQQILQEYPKAKETRKNQAKKVNTTINSQLRRYTNFMKYRNIRRNKQIKQ